MNRIIISSLAFAFCVVSIPPALSQSSDRLELDGKAFSKVLFTSIISSIKPPERRGAQALFAHQLDALPADMLRRDATDQLLALLRADDSTKNDILGVLAVIPSSWETSNFEQDTNYIYNQLILQTSDARLKIAPDNALANARGLYRDGIRRFNTDKLSEVISAEPRLAAMSSKCPKSSFGERACFYIGQVYSKRFTLKDEAGTKLIGDSNKAFETYITRAQNKDFDGRTDYLAAGYYFRGLNGWLAGDIKDAHKWLIEGQKISDNDRAIYIYVLFVSPDLAFNKGVVIDEYLPAKATFSKTLQFLNRTPTPTWSWERTKELTSLLRR